MKIFSVSLAIFLLSSCQIFTYKCIIKGQQIESSVISVSIANTIPSDLNHYIIHAQVDGSDFRYYYLFYKEDLRKRDFKLTKKELKEKGSPLYKLAFNGSYFIPFSHLDSLVINKVVAIRDSVNLNELYYLSNARGFVLEKTLRKKKL